MRRTRANARPLRRRSVTEADIRRLSGADNPVFQAWHAELDQIRLRSGREIAARLADPLRLVARSDRGPAWPNEDQGTTTPGWPVFTETERVGADDDEDVRAVAANL